MALNKQSTLFRGIYEFDDPSGGLLAARVPAMGSADLYSGTAIIVKPSQCAVFVHKGKVADVLLAGTHQVKTENLPLLSRLANWRFGFESPLRSEIVFISGQVHLGRRWGTSQPFLTKLEGFGTVPIRSYGNFNVAISDPGKFFMKLMGTRSTYSLIDLEEFIQGQILELLPSVFEGIENLDQLSSSLNQVSKRLEAQLTPEIQDYGISCQKIQILSALPSKEVLDALDAKNAIKVIGSQREYLLYKAANSLLGDGEKAANDPMQMMLGLMLGKGLLGAEGSEKEIAPNRPQQPELSGQRACASCGHSSEGKALFCSQCGKRF